MCGILGSINIKITDSILNLLKHRGPDDSGICEIETPLHKIWLAHRRLSIIDLSSAGHQPFITECNNYSLIFNGEIYNHNEIRKNLKQKKFKGHSDTETVIYALKEIGILAAEKFNGIFAFAFFDNIKKTIYIARDFFGVKPLYYCLTDNQFIFSSELRPIEDIFNSSLDCNNLSTLLRLRYIPSPYTLYNNVRKVRPGHYIEINLLGKKLNPIEKSFNLKSSELFKGNFKEAVHQYENLIAASIRRQMMSDVEIGIMLSGGIDSAVIATLSSRNHPFPKKAFTVGFEGTYNEDETKEAGETAKILDLEHHIIKITNIDFFDLIAKCVKIIEEPAATTSIIPFYYLSKTCSEYVKVVLTGQGADEPLGGYGRYKEELLQQNIPSFILKGLCAIVNKLGIYNERIRRGARAISIDNDVKRFEEAYSLFSNNQIKSLIGVNNSRSIESIQYNYDLYHANELSQSALRMMKIDARMNLADDLLNYTDKISMHFSLETRIPFLDTELLAFIESLPLSYKANLFKSKIVHKKYAEAVLPLNIVNRNKKGFLSPTSIWFRKDIDVIGELLTQTNSKFSIFFDFQEIKRILDLHKKGVNLEKQLFLLLSIYFWFENQFQ